MNDHLKFIHGFFFFLVVDVSRLRKVVRYLLYQASAF